MRTYSSILATYQPEEQGDFFRQYKIAGNTYIIFSPVAGEISCVEAFNFAEITADELSMYLDISSVEKETEEFTFEVSCTKEMLLTYIFDIKSLDDRSGEYVHHVRSGSGVMLVDAKAKMRNMFDAGIDDHVDRLAFDNTTCFRTNNLFTADKVFVCFNPRGYKRLIDTLEIMQGQLIYLLSSANPVLLEMVFEVQREVSVLMGKWDGLNVLELLIFYLRKENCVFEFYHDEKQVTIGFPADMEVEDIINLASLAEKGLREYYGVDGVKVCYALRKVGERCFLNFRNFPGVTRSFCVALMKHFDNPLNIVM
jgi:hypothetical protein